MKVTNGNDVAYRKMIILMIIVLSFVWIPSCGLPASSMKPGYYPLTKNEFIAFRTGNLSYMEFTMLLTVIKGENDESLSGKNIIVRSLSASPYYKHSFTDIKELYVMKHGTSDRITIPRIYQLHGMYKPYALEYPLIQREKMNIVFDYLVEHADYFFNNAEYKGSMGSLALMDSPHFDTSKAYNCTFKIYLEFEPSRVVLAFSKSSDTTDEIWDGLIEVMDEIFHHIELY